MSPWAHININCAKFRRRVITFLWELELKQLGCLLYYINCFEIYPAHQQHCCCNACGITKPQNIIPKHFQNIFKTSIKHNYDYLSQNFEILWDPMIGQDGLSNIKSNPWDWTQIWHQNKRHLLRGSITAVDLTLWDLNKMASLLANDIFKYIFLTGNVCIFIQIWMKYLL